MVSLKKANKAWKAVTRFRSMTPTLTGFARALTGNPKVTVRAIESGAYTKGNVIYLSPPISLGDDQEHSRPICNLRDENKQLLCGGCKQQEDVLYRMMHEMGHIVYGSLSPLEFAERKDLLGYAKDTWMEDFPWFAKKIHENFAAFTREHSIEEGTDVLTLGAAVHNWLQMFVNLVEDVRVDNRTFDARPGVRLMGEAQSWEIMAEGITYYDSEGELAREYWKDRDLDHQVMVGLLHRGFKYKMDHFLSHEAVAVLDDPVLLQLTRELVTRCTDELESFRAACDLLHRLHQLGLCDPPPEPEEDESEEGKDGDSEKDRDGGEDTPSSASLSKGDGDQDSTGGSTPSSHAGNDAPASPDPDAEAKTEASREILKAILDHAIKCEGTPSDEEAIKVAIIQAMWFESPSVNIIGVEFHRWKDRHSDRPSGFLYTYQRGWANEIHEDAKEYMPTEAMLGKSVTHARVVFSDNQRSKMVRSQKSGRIASGKLHRAAVDDPRMFQRKLRPGRKDYYVCVMLDVSGSNMGGTIVDLRHMAMAQGELLSRVGVKFEMFAHTGLPTETYMDDRGFNLALYPVKELDEPWSTEQRKRVSALDACAANLDGHALEFARKRCDAVRATGKIILYSSDGAMPAENYHEELEILQREIRECQRRRYTLLGVGLRTDSPVKHGLETVIVNEPADIRLVVRQLEKHLEV